MPLPILLIPVLPILAAAPAGAGMPTAPAGPAPGTPFDAVAAEVLPLLPLLLLALATLGGLLLLRAALWRLLDRLAGRLAVREGRSGRARRWVARHPARAWLRRRAPRAYGLLRRRLDPRRFAGLPLTLLALAALYLAALFGGLVEAVREADSVHRLDVRLNLALGAVRAPWLLAGMAWLTTLGTGAALAGIAVTATGFLWAGGRARLVPALWLTLLGAQATTWIGKFAVGRTRPDFLADVTAASPSFPSAHATGAMAVLGFVAYAVARDLPGRRRRFELGFWTAALIGLIGLSRMLLSVHYATDVASGYLVGGFWLLAGIALAEWRRGAAMPAASSVDPSPTAPPAPLRTPREGAAPPGAPSP
ncbi:phosphatase PAP2 family protein [Roseomonas sp. NAR14]|uniref:Phosphatase PAP2 family protein n=1 Tax=Roseomonas acroporae TaxID=2937791 RepID=A0A9X2BUV3_9PROT|nr:phosphatase PAP2 family protein [Roseomonas acroporae]MCK8785998.1 phosphatase PAP2 family protein [Roseomonas acroporae]